MVKQSWRLLTEANVGDNFTLPLSNVDQGGTQFDICGYALYCIEVVDVQKTSDGTIPKFTSIPMPIPIKCSISILILDSIYNISCGG